MKNYLKKLLVFVLAFTTIFSLSISHSIARMDEMMTDTVFVDSKEVWGPFIEAFGQNEKGTIFTSEGGICWEDSDKVSGNISLGVSFAGKVISISVGYQPGRIGSGSTKYYYKCPSHLYGRFVKLYIKRLYRISKYAVYNYNKYSGQKNKRFSRYMYVKKKISHHGKIMLAR